MSPFNQPKGIVAYGDMKVMLNFLDAFIIVRMLYPLA